MARPETHICSNTTRCTARFPEQWCIKRRGKKSHASIDGGKRLHTMNRKSKGGMGQVGEEPEEVPAVSDRGVNACRFRHSAPTVVYNSVCRGVKQIETPTTSSTPLSSYRLIVLMQLSSSSLPASYVSSSPSHFTAQVLVCFANGRSINSDLESSATVYRL